MIAQGATAEMMAHGAGTTSRKTKPEGRYGVCAPLSAEGCQGDPRVGKIGVGSVCAKIGGGGQAACRAVQTCASS